MVGLMLGIKNRILIVLQQSRIATLLAWFLKIFIHAYLLPLADQFTSVH